MSTMLGLAAIRAGGFRTLWRQALMSASGTFRTLRDVGQESGMRSKADVGLGDRHD